MALDYTALGKRISTFRNASGLTQEQFCEKLKAVEGRCLIECASVEFISFIEDAYRCLRRGER